MIFWLIHRWMFDSQVWIVLVFGRVLVGFFLSAPQSVCAVTLRNWIVLLHFDIKYLIWGLNVHFFIKNNRNFCSWTMRILVESSLRREWLCILPRLQKCIHCVLLLENLKPFLMVQSSILFRHCWSRPSIDLQQIRKLSSYNEPLTPKFKHFTIN